MFQRKEKPRRGKHMPSKRRQAAKPPEKKKPDKHPKIPDVLVRGNVIYIKGKPAPPIFNPWLMAITLFLILIGGLSGAMAAAQITQTERLIAQARSQRAYYQNLNVTLREHLSERYTNYEIERIATERLGMARPDPSQVIEIYVPRFSYVVLNTDDDIMPRENYFWREIVTFLSGIADRIFGG